MDTIAASTPIKRALFRYALEAKRKNLRKNGQYTHPIYDRIFFRKVAESLGGCVKSMSCGSAPIKPEILEDLSLIFSCPVFESYG
jgi:long-chain acyl-CoA synthetase